MKNIALLLLLAISLTACNTMYVSRDRKAASVPTLGVEWPTGYADEKLQPRIDSVINDALARWNKGQHSFTINRRQLRDKAKDYISIDFRQVKVVGTGGKIAGYVITPIGLALPIVLATQGVSFPLAFYYWPEHRIQSEVSLSSNLSDDRRNHKNLYTSTGALFASTSGQVNKMLDKYGKAIEKILLSIELQLQQNK